MYGITTRRRRDSGEARPRGAVRRALAGLTVAALAAGSGLGLARTAAADSSDAVAVSDASFVWGLDATASAGAYFGGCNFLSAGAAGDTGSSVVWTQSSPSPGYAARVGNVSVEKPDTAGTYAEPTWATRCQGPDGGAVSTSTNTGSRVRIVGGSGTVDPSANTASIQWEGSFTSAFYGGMVYWTATDPKLTVNADGSGEVTATLGGYGADMNDASKWAALPATVVTLAELSGAEVTDSGFTVAPSYRGVEVSVPGGGAGQYRSGADWGSWPQSFVDFQQLTGESSYWYSSNLADADKVAAPLTVDWSTPATTPAPDPHLSVSPATGAKDGDTLTVSGTGYDTATANPHGTGNAGAYVELGWIQDSGWQPSQGYPSSTRSNVSAVWVHSTPTAGAANEAQLGDDGSFQVDLTVDKAALDAKKLDGGTLAVFTVGAGGTVNAGVEAAAPITLDDGAATAPGDDQETVTASLPADSGSFSWTIDATDHAVTLGDAADKGAYLESTGDLLPVVVTDTRTGGPAWSVSGQIGDFTGGLSGRYLGWTPGVAAAGAGAVPGASVAPGLTAGDGLTAAATLASADGGHAAGSATVGAGLDIQVPAGTPGGTYTATLTLTALS
ncbi:hypothetical protein RVR_2598 [Actinacidiphila reveromycinica]|uniref:Htaa domain-containing protein n=1 Tax=Actinacidiphila reveromycinica TaxID=659352 RepID=A0A7U3UQY3_9ACTN|nr:hypothetical protein [Streptomyces sp. SN-593]BBA97038.1 hypothetical protein RVR_2598 [Streptomyces sp. SN-593]